jgi:ABC-type amino acid transport substrate-binding protein
MMASASIWNTGVKSIVQFRNLTALCILLLAILAGSVQARDISMLTVEWAPHYGSELPEQGLTTAIVKAAFKAEGHNPAEYKTLRDLTPYSIGISRGFANSEEFDAASYLDKHVATFPNLNIHKLFRGRIDMAVMNFDLFRYEAKKEGFCFSDVEFMEPPLETHGLFLMASRQISDGEKIIQDFNRGLDKIRRNGEFDRIVGRLRK